MQDEHDQRVRERAYRMWLDEGCPDGRADAHWDMASELTAIEESQKDTLRRNPIQEYDRRPLGEPVEPLLAVENAGEFPTLTEEEGLTRYPSRANLEDADRPPLSVRRNS